MLYTLLIALSVVCSPFLEKYAIEKTAIVAD